MVGSLRCSFSIHVEDSWLGGSAQSESTAGGRLVVRVFTLVAAFFGRFIVLPGDQVVDALFVFHLFC